MATITTVDPYGEAAFPYCVVPDKVLRVFEDNGMSVNDFERNGHVLCFEIEAYTTAGGEMNHVLYLNDNELDNIPSWREAFYRTMDNFDPWKEAFKWCDPLGQPQRTPFDNGADLFKDIQDYKNDVMQTVYDKLMEL